METVASIHILDAPDPQHHATPDAIRGLATLLPTRLPMGMAILSLYKHIIAVL